MVIYGASGHCKVVIDILEASGIDIDYIVDDNATIDHLLGYNVVRDTGTYDEALIAIGNCDIRRRIVERIKVRQYITAIHPSAIVSPRAKICEGSVVMQGAIIQSCATIGKHCIINTGASIDHENVIGDYVHISPQTILCGDVSVGAGTWIGAGSVIRQGITIGCNCMIGAGSVVVSDIPDNVVAFGNPCKVIKSINQYIKPHFMRNVVTELNTHNTWGVNQRDTLSDCTRWQYLSKISKIAA